MINIIDIPNNNYFANRSGLKPRYVIIHGTAGGTSAQAIANYFVSTQGTPNPVSSNYVAGQDGAIVRCVDEANGAFANGYLSPGHDAFWNESINPNLITISIEHCNPANDNSAPLTTAQKAASFALIRDICQRNNIPMRVADANGGITVHFSIDPVNRLRCPGNYPWPALWAYLKGNNTVGVPQGWKDDGTVLTAPNGIVVVHGFRDYILSNTWDAANEPAEVETHVSQLELFDTALGGGQRQIFRDCMLVWTPASGVLRSYIGLELAACYTLIGSLHSTIIQQQQQLQKAQNTVIMPVVTPQQPTIKMDDLVAALHDLIDKSDMIVTAGSSLKAAGQRALADIGKA
jgi:hypothetical protein